MKKYLIEEPYIEMRALRELEPGMVLGDDCTSPSGQVLYRKKTMLDTKKIDKLKRFSVRRVPILTTRSQWVSASEMEEKGEDVEILKERTEPASTHEKRETDATGTDAGSSPEEQTEEESVPEVSEVPESLETVLLRRQQESLGQGDRDLARVLASVLTDLLNLTAHPVPEDENATSPGDLPPRSGTGVDRTDVINQLADVIGQHDDQFFARIEEMLRADPVSERDQKTGNTGEERNRTPGIRSDEDRRQRTDLEDPVQFEEMDRLFGLLETVLARSSRKSPPGKHDLESPVRGRAEGDPGEGSSSRGPREIMAALDQFEQKQARLFQMLHETGSDPEQILQALEWLRGGEPPVPESFGSEWSDSLVERMEQLVRQRSNLQEEIGEVLDSVPDQFGEPGETEQSGPGEQEQVQVPPAEPDREQGPEEAMDRVQSNIREGEWSTGLEELVRVLQGSLQDHPEVLGRFRGLATRASEMEHAIDQPISPPLDDDEQGESGADAPSDVEPPEVPPEPPEKGGESEHHDDKNESFLSRFQKSLRQVREVVPDHKRHLLDEISRLIEVARGTPLSPDDHAPMQEEQGRNRKEVLEALENGNLKALARLTPLSPSTIRSMDYLYHQPKELDKNQKHLLKPIKTLIEHMFYLGEWKRDHVGTFLRRVRELIESTHKPFRLYILNSPPEQYLLSHAYNACITGYLLGDARGLSEERMEHLICGIAWMDLGMSNVPESLFLHSDSLSNRGRQEIYKHPLYTRRLLSRGDLPEELVQVAVEHHERADGTGYPRGIRRESLSLPTLAQHADVYSALLEPRPHRGAMFPDEALTFMEEKLSWPDGELLDVLRGRVGFYPNGAVLALTDGRLCIVQQQGSDPRRPRVVMLTDRDRNKLDSPRRVKLQEEELEVEGILQCRF